MSCWSLESPLSFMLAGMEGLRPRQWSWPSRTPTAAGSPAASPKLLLPDNPKPTTRPRQRALTGRRGKGRAPTAPPASCSPAPPVLRRRAGCFRQGGARACVAFSANARLCVPLALGAALRPPGAAASVWSPWVPPPRPTARGPDPAPTALPRRPRFWPRASAACLPLSLSPSPGRRLAAWCLHGRCVHRGCGWCLWRV